MTPQNADETGLLLTGDFDDGLGGGDEAAALKKPGGASSRSGQAGKKKKPGLPLPCPVRLAMPEHYAKIHKSCKAQTYKGLSKVDEHIWRYHSWDTRCTLCGTTFRMTPKKDIDRVREEHRAACEPRELTDKEKETLITWISKEKTEAWKKWKETLGSRDDEDDDDTAVRHWKCVFAILFPDMEIPDPLATPPAPPAPRRGVNPSASQLQEPPSSSQPRGKRQASSSPAGQRLAFRMKLSSPEQQTTDHAAGHASSTVVPNDLVQYPSKQANVPMLDFLQQPSTLAEVERFSLFSSYSSDVPPELKRLDLHLAAVPPHRESTPGPESMVRSDTSAPSTDLFPRLATPDYVSATTYDMGFGEGGTQGVAAAQFGMEGLNYNSPWPSYEDDIDLDAPF